MFNISMILFIYRLIINRMYAFICITSNLDLNCSFNDEILFIKYMSLNEKRNKY